MKKFVALLLAAMMLLAMVACGNDPQPTPDPEPTPEPTVDTTVVDELYAAFDASMAEQLGETPAPNGEKIGAVIISPLGAGVSPSCSAIEASNAA